MDSDNTIPLKSTTIRRNAFMRMIDRFRYNVRITVSMIKAIYYIELIGLKNAAPSIFVQLGWIFIVMIIKELYPLIFARVVSDLYHLCLSLILHEPAPVKQYLINFLLATVTISIVSQCSSFFILTTLLI